MFYAGASGKPLTNPDEFPESSPLPEQISARFLKENHVVGISGDPNGVVVALTDPFEEEIIEAEIPEGIEEPEQIDGSEDREIVLTIAGNPLKLTGEQYLLHFAMPNFYFHCATAHAILRQAGIDVGKRDFIGGM